MSRIAAVIAVLEERGVSAETILAVVKAMAEEPLVDAQAERRRAADRERKRAKSAENSAEVCGSEPRARVVISNSPTENIIKNPPTEGKKPEPKSKTDRGHRLPADWRPNLDGQAFAAEKFGIGWPSELEKFTNHWAAASGSNSVKRDWSAAWRNWVLRAAEYRPKTGPPRQRRPRFSDFIHEDFHERTRSTGPASNATSAHDAAGIRSTGLSAEPDSAGASGDVIDLRPSGAGWR